MNKPVRDQPSGQRFRLGAVWIAPEANDIGGLRSETKAMDVLMVLVDAASAVVSTAEILARVWPSVIVVDNVVHRAISNLRKLLGDSASTPRFIEQIPRRGYRLLVPVEYAVAPDQNADENETQDAPGPGLITPSKVEPLAQSSVALIDRVIAQRLSRLSEDERLVLQSAAAIGRTFSDSILLRVMTIDATTLTRTLHTLIDKQFLRAMTAHEEMQFEFCDPALCEVALAASTTEHRVQLHHAIAQALIATSDERAEATPGLIARQFDSAGHVDEALRWHERAARRLHNSDRATEIGHWERILILGEPAAGEPARRRAALRASANLLKYGAAVGAIDFDRGCAIYRRGRAIAAQLDRPDLEARLVGSYAPLAANFEKPELALEAAADALRITPHLDDPRIFVATINDVVNTYFATGRPDQALALIGSALDSEKLVAAPMLDRKGLLWMRGHVLIQFGRLEEARSVIELVELAVGQRSDEMDLDLEDLRCYELEERGYPAAMRPKIETYIEAADHIGMHYHRCNARRVLALWHLFNGDAKAALELIEISLGIAAAAASTFSWWTTYEALRPRALSLIGDQAAARAIVDQLVAPSTKKPTWQQLIAHAEVLIAGDAVKDQALIAASLAEAAEIAARRGNVCW